MKPVTVNYKEILNEMDIKTKYCISKNIIKPVITYNDRDDSSFIENILKKLSNKPVTADIKDLVIKDQIPFYKSIQMFLETKYNFSIEIRPSHSLKFDLIDKITPIFFYYIFEDEIRFLFWKIINKSKGTGLPMSDDISLKALKEILDKDCYEIVEEK